MTIADQVAEIWKMEKATKRTDREQLPAAPWGVYPKLPRRCTECGSKDLVRDGQYYCVDCHPTHGKDVS